MGISTNEFDKLRREQPSQLVVTAVKESYDRMVLHATTEFGRWACRKNGAAINAMMTWRTVYDRATGAKTDALQVMHLYCHGCETKPLVKKGDAIFADLLMTVSM